MTYYFTKLLDDVDVENKLVDTGNDGHMGIIFKPPYSDNNMQIIKEMINFLIENN